jgi:hypothetical protein
MSRLLRRESAGVLVLVVAGCTFDSFLTPLTGSLIQKQAVSCSLAQVSAKLEEGLSEAGIAVLAKQLGSEIRLAGRTKSGKVFCLYLYGQKVAGADKTLVHIKWGQEADEPFWQMVLGLLATLTPDPDKQS